eukprot:Clim_evm44s153 gene=Clim_evmTU44s153
MSASNLHKTEGYGFAKSRNALRKDDEEDVVDSDWMDASRAHMQAYEYLCHLEEVKQWLEGLIQEELPPSTELEEGLRNGVYLAKLAMFYAPDKVTKRKIFDISQEKYHENGLHFRHTDNTAQWLKSLDHVGLPNIFYPETTDIYDKKNMPKAIYCIHALSHFLYKKGMAPLIQNLVGKAQFTEEELSAMQQELNRLGVNMPAFGKIGGVLAKELGQNDAERIAAIIAINEAVEQGNADETLARLLVPVVGLVDVEEAYGPGYQDHLAFAKQEKTAAFEAANPDKPLEECDVFDRYLTGEEIQANINASNVSQALAFIDASILEGDPDQLLQAMKNKYVPIHNVDDDNKKYYMHSLRENRDAKGEALTKKEVEMAVEEANLDAAMFRLNRAIEAGDDEGVLFALEDECLNLPEVRGDLARPYTIKLAYERDRLGEDLCYDAVTSIVNDVNAKGGFEDEVTKIQAFWRGQTQRRKYLEMLDHYYSNQDAIVKCQAAVRGTLARRKHDQRLAQWRNNLGAIIRIQAWYRGYQARTYMARLLAVDDPMVKHIRWGYRTFIEGHEDVDFNEELSLTKMRQKYILELRQQRELQQELNAMDVKIGLLIKNQLELSDVVAQSRKLKKGKVMVSRQGFKALNKEDRQRYEGYQYMFYLLQTNPVYLARLLFLLPANRTGKFIESIILTTYNFAINDREQYLVLKLFKAAIDEEMTRVFEIKDFITGNPTVTKMVVQYNRQRGGQEMEFLRDLLQPLVRAVLEEDINMNLNPIDIYKRWIIQIEQETGKAADMAYDVNTEEALSYDHVRNVLDDRIQRITDITSKFRDAIVDSLDKMPYAMRYFASEIRRALEEKFTDADETEIIKVVGNVVYYRFINPAIVAPDAFEVLDSSMAESISVDQRRNLGEIAKLLQIMSAKKRFAEGSEDHLARLNNYLSESWVIFRDFFITVTEIESPERHFNQDQYTEDVMVANPTIFISPREIYRTHGLFLQSRADLDLDEEDPLMMLINELPPPPGYTEEADSMGEQNIGETTEVPVELVNRARLEDTTSNEAVLLKTRRIFFEILRCQKGEDIPSIMATPATAHQEDMHQNGVRRMQERSRRREAAAEETFVQTGAEQQLEAELSMTLNDLKASVQKDLDALEAAGVTSRHDGYQSLLNAMARDIIGSKYLRESRRKDIAKLTKTLELLAIKTKEQEEQVQQYTEYVHSCTENMKKGAKIPKPNKMRMMFDSKYRKNYQQHRFGSYKYSASKLFERGILLELQGVTETMRKGVTFTISSNQIGVFDIDASLTGVKMKTLQITLDELLQMQYEGISVKELFGGSAKVNVNLLIHLLNRKFYSRK